MKPEDTRPQDTTSYQSPNTASETPDDSVIGDKPVVDADNERDTSIEQEQTRSFPDTEAQPTTPRFDAVAASQTAVEAAPEAPMQTAKKSKKPLLIGLAIAVAVVLAGSYGAYAFWYSAPENVLDDAFSKIMKAKTLETEGVINSASESGPIKLAYSFAAMDKKLSSSLDMSWKMEDADYALASKFVVDDKTYYVQPNGIKKIIDSQLGAATGLGAYFDPLVNKLEDKWVKVTPEDVDKYILNEEDTKNQAACYQDVAGAIRTNAAYQNDIVNTYKANRFIVVKENKGIEDVEGSSSYHFVLKVDEKKAEAFGKAFVNTDLFKKFDDCSSDDLKKQFLEENKPEENSDKSQLDLWVDQWSHEPTKYKLSGVDENNNTTSIEGTLRLNKVEKIDVPKADTTVQELIDEYEKLQTQFSDFYMTDLQ